MTWTSYFLKDFPKDIQKDLEGLTYSYSLNLALKRREGQLQFLQAKNTLNSIQISPNVMNGCKCKG